MNSIYANVQVCPKEPRDIQLYRGNAGLSGIEARAGNTGVLITTGGPINTRDIASRLRELADQMDADAVKMEARAAAMAAAELTAA